MKSNYRRRVIIYFFHSSIFLGEKFCNYHLFLNLSHNVLLLVRPGDPLLGSFIDFMLQTVKKNL